MFTVSVETCFWASHRLALPAGPKEPLHHHNWLVTVEVGSEKLNNIGVVMDFHRLKAMLDNIVAEFDNARLEEIDYFRRNNSSAETVAKYIYEKLRTELPRELELEAVSIAEEPGCSAKFTGRAR